MFIDAGLCFLSVNIVKMHVLTASSVISWTKFHIYMITENSL